jgi:hypothetical protein
LTAKVGVVLTVGAIVSLLSAAPGAGQERQSVSPPSSAETAYRACISAATAIRDSSWAARCKSLADKTTQDRADCLSKLNLPEAYCGASYPPRDGSPHCALPDTIASVINAALVRAKYHCVRQREAAASDQRSFNRSRSAPPGTPLKSQ